MAQWLWVPSALKADSSVAPSSHHNWLGHLQVQLSWNLISLSSRSLAFTFCGGLSENGSHWLIYLDTWPTVEGTVLEGLGGMPEGGGITGIRLWGFKSPCHSPIRVCVCVCVTISCAKIWVLSYCSSTLSAWQLLCSKPWWSWTHLLKLPTHNKPLLLGIVSYHSNRKETKTCAHTQRDTHN